jgi:diguanylate cyclase (GGDEF)-like protein/PAS domain S-box-containing protein
MVFGQRNRIGRRLVIFIVAFCFLATISTSAAQLVFEFQRKQDDVDRVLEGVAVHTPGIAGDVWDFNEKQIRLTLSALSQLPYIEHARIIARDGDIQWEAGAASSSTTRTRRFALSHEGRGGRTEIGALEVVAGLDGIYREIAARAGWVVFSNILIALGASAFMIMLFRQVVTGRLELLRLKVGALTPDAVHTVIPPQLDELDAVDWTLDHAAARLIAAVEAQKNLNEELRRRVVEQDAILQNALVGILMVRNGRVVSCNHRLEEIFGYDRGGIDGMPVRDFFSDDTAYAEARETICRSLSRGLSYTGTLRPVKCDGTGVWVEVAGRALDPAHPDGAGIWICSDVTGRKAAEDRIEFIAFHDQLTGLPNRHLAQDRLHQAITAADHTKAKVALLALDLDNFKTINDSLGHSVGDEVIREIARRLRRCVGVADTVCRYGGDEFVIVLPDLHSVEATGPIIIKLMEQLNLPCIIDAHELTTSGSIGIAIYPEDGDDFDTLLKKADLAMYRAKNAGRNTYRFFDSQMNVEAIEQLSMRNGLRRALANDEFVLHYQPQIDLTDNRVIGVEALIRWNHPELGMISPARFIPIAEDSGLIVPISEWVLREACRQAAAWSRTGDTPIMMAVNLSAVQFKRGDVEQSIVVALEQSGIEPSLLELELTESILISDADNILATIKRIKQLGVKLSIDDFGTGYSSLSYLKRFQVDKLKIDQSFIYGLDTDPENAAIVSAIIQMAKSLGLTTIAEGVETLPTLERLQALGCTEAQGYYFARPMPAKDVALFRQRRNSESER